MMSHKMKKSLDFVGIVNKHGELVAVETDEDSAKDLITALDRDWKDNAPHKVVINMEIHYDVA